MDDLKSCNVGSNCWTIRYEIVGIILLVLATILTLITLNGFGIAAMFIVGAALCCHKCFMYTDCHTQILDEELDLIAAEPVVKSSGRKTKIVDKL